MFECDELAARVPDFMMSRSVSTTTEVHPMIAKMPEKVSNIHSSRFPCGKATRFHISEKDM